MSAPDEHRLEPSDFPALFQAANQVAIDGHRRYKRLASFELVLLVVGSVAGTTLATVGGGARVGATIGVWCFRPRRPSGWSRGSEPMTLPGSTGAQWPSR